MDRKKAETLGLEGNPTEHWKAFIQRLSQAYIGLRMEDDSLIWSENPTNGKFTTSLGYKAMFEEGNEEED